MKKPFTHNDRGSGVFCANPKCAEVRGIQGVVRQQIKQNVVARHPEGTKLFCYDCALWRKTGLTRSQRKRLEEKKAKAKTMTAGA